MEAGGWGWGCGGTGERWDDEVSSGLISDFSAGVSWLVLFIA